MLKVYDNKKYEMEEITQAFLNGHKEINRHAATLVLSVIIKLFDSLLCILDKVYEIL